MASSNKISEFCDDFRDTEQSCTVRPFFIGTMFSLLISHSWLIFNEPKIEINWGEEEEYIFNNLKDTAFVATEE